MNFNKLNVITGWVVFLVAAVVFTLTTEPTASFWDCGEFIATAYKLEVGHPPGAPLFMLLARVFSAFADTNQVAFMINMLSVLSSALTVLFLFWSITHLAKKLVNPGKDSKEELSKGALIAVLGSGAVGALAYAFSDTFWFSAVEGEVYALSSLFTAVVFWAILKWETLESRGGELRWLILIAYLMGLSIGVHLLNLLAIPAICFVYYFKKYPVTRKGVIWTSLISLGLLALIQTGVIIYLVKIAAFMERTFVNSFSLPFNTGVIFYVLLLIGLITLGLRWSKRKGYVALNTLILGISVAIIGYTSFATVVIRSYANPPIDENNPQDVFSLLAYLNREQYGNRPLIFGNYFNTPLDDETPYMDGPPTYVKSFSVYEKGINKETLVKSYKNVFEAEQYIAANADKKLSIRKEYIDTGEKKGAEPNYKKDYFFPRMYSSQGNHEREYKKWSNYQGYNDPKLRGKLDEAEAMVADLEQQKGELESYLTFYQDQLSPQDASKLESDYRTTVKALDKYYDRMTPSFGENMRFFFSYQVGWMYLRYFMWNFAGRQNDIQGHGDFMDGNWLTGISMLDEQRLGNQDQLPEMAKANKGFNKLFMLPLILGIMGLVFQVLRHPKDFSVVTMLFLLTGVAIVVYLNQYPNQPRERDYAYAGSFYAFAIWIGLGVFALYHAAVSMTKKDFITLSGMTLGGSAFIFLVESVTSDSHSFGYHLIYVSVVVLALTGIMYLIGNATKNDMAKGVLSVALCLPAIFILAAEGWDDHDRADRRTGFEYAVNYLESLEKDAIIFTNGDNDTFPLWYAQEVEGVRTDVRIVNLSLLNTDWYIDQMKRQAYESEPVPFSLTEQQYRQGTRDVVVLDRGSRSKPAGPVDISQAMSVCLDDTKTKDYGAGRKYNYLPSYVFTMKIDSVVKETYKPFLKEGDSLVDQIEFGITDDNGRPKQFITKNQLMVLDLLNTFQWKRPVYFATTTGSEVYMGLEPYFQLEGMAYRMTPIYHRESANPNVIGGIATDVMYNNIMNKFMWGNVDKADVYMDENNRRMTTNLRLHMGNLANELILEKDNAKALDILNKAMEVMPEKNVPYDRVIWTMAEAYFKAGDPEKGAALTKRIFELNEDQYEYYLSLDDDRKVVLEDELTQQLYINQRLILSMEDALGKDHPDVKALQEKENVMLQTMEIEPEKLRESLDKSRERETPKPMYKDTIIGRDTVRIQL
ncbi:MAG: hypothetical protein RL220_169 [Bacteroidota bacterium]